MTQLDQHCRPIGVLRLSLTALCNLACPYCLPDSKEPLGLINLEQRLKIVKAAVELGVHSLRLTGGEPLLNPDLEELITAINPLRNQGLSDIALTSNGFLLNGERAHRLRKAGLNRISLSLDGTTADSVARMAGIKHGELHLAQVLAAIGHARSAGFDPAKGDLKLNAVIEKGKNDNQLIPLAELARNEGIELRLIEYMDVGNRNGWQPEAVLTSAEMIAVINKQWALEPLKRRSATTAKRWQYTDRKSYLATIASISEPFCGDCNRLRVTANGIAYTCLFASQNSGLDLRDYLQANSCSGDLKEAIGKLWGNRSDRYSEQREQQLKSGSRKAPAEMALLGG